ncbi:MAG: hypothetical protein P4L81_00220 [Candidatus Pacebacteria bacterium]|nr:hypothetical protein [Candidatus Paceibacterota bacterium]
MKQIRSIRLDQAPRMTSANSSWCIGIFASVGASIKGSAYSIQEEGGDCMFDELER